MRRSAAPSQIGNAAKKARFIPPFLQKDTRPDSNPLTVIGQLKHQTCGSINSSEWLSAVSQKRNVLSQLQSKQKDDVKVGTYACTSISRTGEARLSASPASCKTPDDSKENDCAEDKTSNGILSQSERIIQHSIKATCKFPLDSLMHPKSAVALKTSELSTLNRRSFKAPVQKKPSDTRTVSHEDSSTVQASYYSVMWCKRSKKKHKKWEGDAVLITKGKSVSLLDMDGKEIGKSSGYKVSELECMEEGQSLLIGGKEIEVLGKIAKEDFHAGKCFQSAITMSSDHRTLPQVSKVSRKAFCNPQKTQTMKTQVPSSAPQPLFDPSSPNVLILPRPSPSHQWQNNNNQSFVVDVVADPYLVCKLRPHQREGVKFLYECVMGMRSFKGHGAILADDMGLGKTLQCITLIWTLLRQGPYNGKPVIKRILVVTPGSLVKNWCYEFNKWLGKERLNAFGVGSDRKIQEFLHSPIYPVMVVSYEMAVRYADDLHKIKFDLMVCDEAHRLKSNTIKTTSILNSLSIKRRILLTGTPIQNDLKEFYSLAEFCNPSILGSESLFHRLYEEPVLRSRQPEATEEEKKIGKMRAVELSRIMALFVLRRTQEVNNKYLPPKVENVIFCKPKPLQLSLYRHLLASRLVRRCLTRGITGDATAPHLICIGALKKLCNHPTLLYESGQKALEESEALTSMDMYGVEKEISLYDGLLPLFPFDYKTEQASPSYSGKLATLAAMLHVLHTFLTQEKIVVVSNYTQTLDILQTFCEAEGYKVSRLDGTTPTAKRQQIVDHFNSKHSKETVFLLSSKAGGVGLNLIGASRLILYDIDWNPANDLQSMARVWRDGQRKQVHIYRLITAGTVEEKVFQRQISKQGLSGAVVDVTDRSEVKFSLEDLKDLFTLHEDVSCLTHDMLNCHCSGDGRTVTEEDSTEVRLCQLGKLAATSGTKKKTVSMAKLLKWKHYSYPFQGCSNDDLLKAAGQDITYIFQNETNLSGTAGSAESDV